MNRCVSDPFEDSQPVLLQSPLRYPIPLPLSSFPLLISLLEKEMERRSWNYQTADLGPMRNANKGMKEYLGQGRGKIKICGLSLNEQAKKKHTLFIFVQIHCRSANEDCLQPFMWLHLLVWDSKHICVLQHSWAMKKRTGCQIQWNGLEVN